MPKKVKTLLVFDHQYLPTALTLIASAKVSIEVFCYAFSISKFDRSSAPFQIAEALAAATEKNDVKTRIFMEGVRDTQLRNRKAGEYLKRHGVEVKYGSTHVKAICVDSKYLLIGSTNLTHQSIEKNNETNLLLSSEDALGSFGKYFEQVWKTGNFKKARARLEPLIANGDFENEIVESLKTVKKTVYFSIYVFDIESIINALIKAHRRRVKVVGLFHDHRTFALEYVRRNKRTIAKLRAAGIGELYLAPTTLFTHSKVMVIDQKTTLLGTGNWILEDVEVNPQLYVKLANAKLSLELVEHLKLTISEQGREA